jgi:hypothetical protein
MSRKIAGVAPAHWTSSRPTIGWWTSKSGCSAFPRRRHSMRGGCSGCALTDSAWSCHRPCITTTRPGARRRGPPRKRRRPATGTPGARAGCRCGIYGAVAGTLDSLPGYLRDTTGERDPWAYAEIACYGRVFADMRGVRAERARLVRIALPATGWPGEAAPREASRALRERYGVPAGGAECVPPWLTANARPGGPPPDGESLSLDLARLDLSCQGDPAALSGERGVPPAAPASLTARAERRGSGRGRYCFRFP